MTYGKNSISKNGKYWDKYNKRNKKVKMGIY